MNPYKDIQPRIQSIPQERIIRKMDEYMSRRDYAGAERHLKYWLEEAKMGNDRRGELLIRNELVGHFRKTGNREEALQNGDVRSDHLLRMAKAQDISQSVLSKARRNLKLRCVQRPDGWYTTKQ